MERKTVIGLYENRDRAESAIQDLKNEGFASGDIQLKGYDEFARGKGREEEGFWRSFLQGLGLTGTEERPAGMDKGDFLVVLDADEAQVDHAADILNRHGALDIDERASRYKEAREGAPERAEYREEKAGVKAPEKLEEREEALKVGTRPVSRGGVRIFTRPTEREVEEPVTLREEEVHVERRPVDRPASGREAGAFKDESFEVRAKGEEPVVGKETRVKEEVEVTKTPVERKETIHETLRGTKVEVERLSPEEESRFMDAESEFHADYDKTYSSTGAKYEDLLPAYRYGYHLGQDPFFSGADWREVEPKVKKNWEEHKYGGWDFYKSAVHKGWERAHH